MKIVYPLLLLGSLLVCSCQKTSIELSEKLTEPASGWVMQTLTVHSGDMADDLNSGIAKHYKQVGNLTFLTDVSGIYTFDTTSHSFTYSLTDNTIFIDIENNVDYNSPFLYYYFAGQIATPFTSFPEEHLKFYSLRMINDYTLQMRFEYRGVSSQDNFGSIEIILTEVN